jgi:hypothetical protein
MNLNESNDIKVFKFNLCSNNFYQDLASDLNNLIDSKFNINKLKQFTNIIRIGKYFCTFFIKKNFCEDLKYTFFFFSNKHNWKLILE